MSLLDDIRTNAHRSFDGAEARACGSDRIKAACQHALCFLLVFLLAFSCTWHVQSWAFADETGGEVAEPIEPENPPAPDDPQEPVDPPPPPAYTVDGLDLYYETPGIGAGWTSVSTSWAPSSVPGTIVEKAGTLTFKTQCVWSDGSTSWADGSGEPVSYAVSDPAVATIDAANTLHALSNGTVRVTATLASNPALTVHWDIVVTGQDYEPYVTAIDIVDESGTPYSTTGITLEDLNATVKLYAAVTVHDPATESDTVYLTSNGQLAAQTGGAIADLVWSVSDTTLGYVDAVTGQYRPVEHANVQVFATSAAGLGGAAVSGSVWVTTRNPEVQEDGYNPQGSLTVKVTYELAPDQVVEEKTWSAAEMEAMVDYEATYSAIGAGRFLITKAQGVLLGGLLSQVGIDNSSANASGVKEFTFGTADNFGEKVSYAMLFGQERYFYPNIDVNNYFEAVPVYPMIAVRNVSVWNAVDFPPDAQMTEGTRFRLLFGALSNGQITTNKQIYWINTINVVLAGGPQEKNGSGNGDGQGAGTGSDSGQGSGGTAGSGESGQSGGLGSSGSGGTENPLESSAAEAAAGAGENDASAEGETGSWSVYQVMTPNRSDVAAPEFDNPLRPYIMPFAVGLVAAGGVTSATYFRRQLRPVLPAGA